MRLGLRSNNYGYWSNMTFGSAYNQGQIPCDSVGPWSNPCSAIVTGGSGSTAVGNSQAPLIIRPPLAGGGAWNAGYGSYNYGNMWTLDQLSVTLTGLVNSVTAGFRTLDICLSLNGGVSCASSTQQMVLGQTSGSQTVGQASTSQYGVLPWLLDTNPRLNVQESSPHSGTGTVSGNTLTWVSGQLFSTYWTTGGNGKIRFDYNPTPTTVGTTGIGTSVTLTSSDRFFVGDTIIISGAGTNGGDFNGTITSISEAVVTFTPSTVTSISSGKGVKRASRACITPPNAVLPSSEYTITSMVDGNNLTVSDTPITGQVYWCEDNFAVMVWRDQAPTDSSTVTLTAASMAAVESTSPTYPDNGADGACFVKQVQGGYFCMYGGLYWINPTTGNSAYYGYMYVPSNNELGQPITNPWHTIGIIPGSESANIDQTQNVLTFYVASTDATSATPVVVQGIFNPTTIATPTTPYVNGHQIGNASVVSSTPYSITYNNGLTFTNLTPQITGNHGILAQMATFDPSLVPSQLKGSGGFNCQSYGFSGTLFYIGCYTSYEDGAAWVLAFSPGDGNPAHATQTGGPQIVGALNTQNAPSNTPVASGYTGMYGHGLHAVVESDNGWAQINTHFAPPISTSNTTLPLTSADCSTFGLASGNQCIGLNINSYTHASVTGYEPYLSPVPAGFTGAPGETRTAQLGDTACVAASSLGSCQYVGQQELLTLVIKDYQGTPGAWVFQRNAYSVQKAITTGPVTLWWESIAWMMPAGSAAAGTFTVYWNPLTGCGGMPDPHGNCMITDTNETGGHGEWRNGGAAVATNVPVWGVPIWGWPTDYQTLLGSSPDILSLSPANVSLFATPGINYVSTNPPFAGYYGHPWGFDAGSHPNPAGELATPNEAIRAFDNMPLQGGGFDPSFTKVSGNLYTAIPTSNVDADDPFGYTTSGGVVAINRKLMAQCASCGIHPLVDISGPASAIATDSTTAYTYCVVRVAGECYAGSVVGQIYVNCPGVTATTCQGSGIHGGAPFGASGADICIGNVSNTANAVRQFTLDRTDFLGAYSRTLVSATARMRMVYGFESNRLLPDNSWLLYRSDWLDMQRAEMWAAKMLPYPPRDNVARGTFVPVRLNLTPATGLAVNNAIVYFGYREYGGPQLLNCTTRNDVCIATAATVPTGTQPFYFQSENPAGASCASGCTITVPAVSQRILYYQIQYRAANNSVLYTGPVTAVVIP